MIRTVWLAVICLISLGEMAAARIGTASLARADIFGCRDVHGKPLMKSDKLDVPKIERALAETAVTTIAILPKTESTPGKPVNKFIGRHWHDPLAP